MRFCTRCGQELTEGVEHICPNVNAYKTPEPQQTANKSIKVNNEEDTIGISIDKEAVKEKYDSFMSQVKEKNAEMKKQNLDSFERNKLIVPDVIDANDGEIPIKQYEVAKLRSRIILSKAEGRLQITNKRLIFRAAGHSVMGKVTLHEEFKIDEIAGIEFRNRPSFNFFNMILALLLTGIFGGLGFLTSERSDGDTGVFFCILGAFMFLGWIAAAVYFRIINSTNRFYSLRLALISFSGGLLLRYVRNFALYSFFYGRSSGTDAYKVIFIALAVLALINVFLIAFVPDLAIKIKTKGGLPGIEIAKEEPVALLSFLFGKSHDENSGFLEILPWKDTNSAIKELGTIVDDIQTLGDAAIKKWKQ